MPAWLKYTWGWYCWWKKSWATWYLWLWNPMKNGIFSNWSRIPSSNSITIPLRGIWMRARRSTWMRSRVRPRLYPSRRSTSLRGWSIRTHRCASSSPPWARFRAPCKARRWRHGTPTRQRSKLRPQRRTLGQNAPEVAANQEGQASTWGDMAAAGGDGAAQQAGAAAEGGNGNEWLKALAAMISWICARVRSSVGALDVLPWSDAVGRGESYSQHHGEVLLPVKLKAKELGADVSYCLLKAARVRNLRMQSAPKRLLRLGGLPLARPFKQRLLLSGIWPHALHAAEIGTSSHPSQTQQTFYHRQISWKSSPALS